MVVIVAHRYGWIPPGKRKSITRLECEHAKLKGKPVIAFEVDPKTNWPAKLKDIHGKVTELAERFPLYAYMRG